MIWSWILDIHCEACSEQCASLHFFTIHFSFWLFWPVYQLAVAAGFFKSQENEMIDFIHLKQYWKWTRVWPLLLSLPLLQRVYLHSPGWVVVSLRLHFSNLNVQMLSTALRDHLVLESDWKQLLKVASWNSAPESDCYSYCEKRKLGFLAWRPELQSDWGIYFLWVIWVLALVIVWGSVPHCLTSLSTLAWTRKVWNRQRQQKILSCGPTDTLAQLKAAQDLSLAQHGVS